MTPRLLLLSLVPLLAIEPGLSSAAGQSLPYADERLGEQLQQAQELARQAGADLLHSLQIIESTIPRYGLPFVDAEGNIVIPRRHRAPPHGTPIPSPDAART
jgi:hypothetical protein